MIEDREMEMRRMLMKPFLEIGEEISIEGLQLFVNVVQEFINLRTSTPKVNK